MGDNAYGQLGHGNTTDNFYLKRIDPAQFNNEAVVFLSAAGGTHVSVFAITETGKCFGWGKNGVGQLGLGNTTNQTTPQEVTAVTGSPIENKVITHIAQTTSTDADGYRHVYFLTSEGKVYAAGDAESYGQYLGVYRSASTNVTRPILLTDSATGCNSDNQKVVSIWTQTYRYSNIYMITDGGDSGLVRMYASGVNSVGQQGTNASTTGGASATTQGNWFMNEAKFQTVSPGLDADRKIRADVGTLRKLGDPCIVYTGGPTNTSTDGWAAMLDSFGQMWITGEWNTHNPAVYFDRDNTVDFGGTSTFTKAWVQVMNQPEPFVSMGFGSITVAEEQWTCVGASGVLYIGGANGYSMNMGVVDNCFNPVTLLRR
jgi:hypothetical protein